MMWCAMNQSCDQSGTAPKFMMWYPMNQSCDQSGTAPKLMMWYTYLDTWILGVVSQELRLLHGRVGNSTTLVNSLSLQMSELVEDAVDS